MEYWHRDLGDFARFFFTQCFVEPHSTKPIEDTVGWAAETYASVLEAEARKPGWPEEPARVLASLDCPVLVIHGTRDRISPYATAVEAARLTGGTLLTLEGSGHIPNVRDPVTVNLALRDFVERLAS